MKMEGQLEHQLEVSVPADVLWKTYRGLELGKLVPELLPHVLPKVEVVEGDGGVGTVLEVFFPPGTPGFTSYKEKLTKIDDEKRVKEAEVCEGGFLDLGFSLYRVRFEIIEVDASSSIIKSVVEYKADNEANASIVSTEVLGLISEAVGKHLAGKK